MISIEPLQNNLDKMEQIQASSMPHIVQVYQSTSNAKIQNPQIIHISHPPIHNSEGKITYQQTITSESLHIPSQSNIEDQRIISQNQIVMSCHQTQIQSVPMHATMQSQVIPDLTQPLQIPSHVILPQVPVFKQHMIVNSIQQQYYGQYQYDKDQQCIVAKVEPELHLIDKQHETKKTKEPIYTNTKKRKRSDVPNPSQWACNVRKLKHQRGEAYISRRGKYVPERRIRTTKDCLKTCIYKCNERISNEDRENLFKAFYSLDVNGKKYFILNSTERENTKNVLHDKTVRRRYSFKYFFMVRSIRHHVCKDFYLGTLAISQKPVYNVHSSKSDMNVPKPDGRGLSEASGHGLSSEVKDRVRNHILSFKTVDGKPVRHYPKKKQYLEASVTIKQLHNMYVNECSKDGVGPVKESMYRKIAKQEFNLHIKRIKSEPVCCKCKTVKKK